MSYTLTPRLGLYKPAPNADDNAWGTHLNLNSDALDALRGEIAYVADYGGSIQAAIDSLPATGGEVMLSSNTTYTVSATLSITKPNTRLTAPSPATIIRRASAFTGGLLIDASGMGCVLDGFTVDGNSVVASRFDVSVTGRNGLVRGVSFINNAGPGCLSLAGQNSRATGNTITGLGTVLSTERGYGIWAVNHVTVMIDHNTITGTGIDAIGFDGDGSQVVGNRVSGCHTWTGRSGGQIASYYVTLGSGVGTGQAVVGNTIGPPGGPQGGGIEAWNPGMVISGNAIDRQPIAAITIFGNGTAFTGNAVRNCGGAGDAVVVAAGVTDFIISGNLIIDQQTTPTMRYGIAVYSGASDRYEIIGNLISGNTAAAVFDQGTGTHKTIVNNQGNNDGSLPLKGGAITGLVTLTPDTSGKSAITIDGATGGQARNFLATTGGVARFRHGMIAGALADSNWNVACFNDAGAFLLNALAIDRATGLVTLGGALRVTGNVGFNNTAPIAKPNVTGAWAGNAAGKALSTALATLGLITDSTTA